MMADYKLRSKQSASSLDEDLIAEKVIEKLFANDDVISKISSKICDRLSHMINENINGLVNKVEQLNIKLQEANEKIDNLEQYSRINNLRVFGCKEVPNEAPVDVFVDFCRTKLNLIIQPSDIDVAHRLRGKENGIRPMIVRFVTRTLKKKVFACKSKLKGSKIVLKEDLTPYSQSLLKKVSKVVPSNSAWTNDGKIFARTGNVIRHIRCDEDIIDLRSKSEMKSSERTS